MPFDPSLPADHSPNSAAQIRGQLNGLNDLITALAAGTVTAVTVDAVNTIAPGQPATVDVNVIGNTLHLTFGIPQGATGATGANGTDGSNGNDGATGPQGAPGEVSNAALATAIAGTALNPNGVATLAMTVEPSYDPAQMQAIANRLDLLIAALRR